jgi:cell division protein FtsB
MKKFLQDKRVIVIVIVVVLVLLLLDFNQRMVLLSKMRGQEKQLTQEYGQLLSTAEALKTEIANANSDDVVEQWAREEAGMVQEGDIPIVLLPAPNTIPKEPTSEPVVVDEIEKWEIWEALFFGE